MVSFVGAGPGAEDLITVRGMRLLEKADVIIYAGSLVSDKLLDYAKSDCQIFNSAKMTLDEVIDVVKKAENNNQNTVRLHTGDPSIYGAIREQMDRLDILGIGYEVVPGVSSFCGAAAALRAEYTLPNVSQSVIITRMEGRTKVPDLERISEFAKHKSTMVIFLSASMTDLVAKELIAGGYDKDTPAAIVYKATWPEEKVIRCTVGTLHSCAKENNISNHALITVGYFLNNDYELSKLYDSGFSTGFRSATSDEIVKVSLISFSDKGYDMAHKISEEIRQETNIEITDIKRCEPGELDLWTANHFRKDDALIYVGACGIATRAIAPYINHKTIDPAVIVVDELGKNVIPLLSGHIGGANILSEIIANKIDANASITTATDINNVWAVDSWAVSKNMTIKNPEYIKNVSSKLLKNESVKLDSMIEIKDLDDITDKIEICSDNPDIVVSYKNINTNKLVLIPKVLGVGIGCKKETPSDEIQKLWDKVISINNLEEAAVKKVGSIDLKSEENGLIEFARNNGFIFETFSAESLNSLKGDYSKSDFVQSVTGVDCVCERSAVMAAGMNDDSCLIVRKMSENGVTIAVALQDKIV